LKITKRDLQNMASIAQDNFVNLAPTGIINGTEFTARCWLESAATILGIKEKIEYEQVPMPEPAEE